MATSSNPTPTSNPKKEAKHLPGISQTVVNELSLEINEMIAFAAHKGLSINTDVNALIENNNVDDLIKAHNLMCENVAPATPKSIEYTKEIRTGGKRKSLFNKVPLVRNLIILTIIFLLAYILIGLSPDVNNDSIDKGVLGGGSGLSLFLNLGYLASISALGVLFHLLKKISTSVEKCTLVPEESVDYIAQILLGIIAGLLLSEILTPYIGSPKDINLANKSLLALVGGFSSDTIFSLLQGLITRVKSVFIPS